MYLSKFAQGRNLTALLLCCIEEEDPETLTVLGVKNRNRKAFTLFEVLVCLLIIAILAALVQPAIIQSREQAHKAASISNMRQLWTAIELYRQDYDGFTDTGTPAQMGLPTQDAYAILKKDTGLTTPVKRASLPLQDYRFFPPDDMIPDSNYMKYWVTWSQACGSRIALLGDFNFNSWPVDDFGDYRSILGIGIRLNGTITQKRKASLPTVGFFRCE